MQSQIVTPTMTIHNNEDDANFMEVADDELEEPSHHPQTAQR